MRTGDLSLPPNRQVKCTNTLSRAALAKAIGISDRQVRKAIEVLRDKRIRRKGGDSGEGEIIG